MATIPSTESFTTQLSDYFRLSGSLTYEDFQHWVSTNSSEISSKLNSSQTALPIHEITTILTDIKTRSSLADQLSLDWCIQKLSSDKQAPYNSETPLVKELLLKEALDHLDGQSTLGSFSIFASDEKNLTESLQSKLVENCRSDSGLFSDDFDINDFGLSVFEIAEKMTPPVMFGSFAFKAFSHWDLFKVLNIDTKVFSRFINEIGQGYMPVPYHNIIHAADVLQACQVFLSTSPLSTLSNLSHLHLSSLLFSAIIHDYKHPGVNNSYLMQTNHTLALNYNDRSILENFHVSEAFKLASCQNFNIFQEFSKEQFKNFRKMTIMAVLATDMTKHSKHVADIQMKLHKTKDLSNEKEFVLGLVLHLADLSNTFREFVESEMWTVRVNQEFFRQGDLEREMGVEVMMIFDRFSANIAKNQSGFIKGVMMPFVTPICREVPELRFMYRNLKVNLGIWTEKVAEYQPPHKKQ